jgi:hypothetical protein
MVMNFLHSSIIEGIVGAVSMMNSISIQVPMSHVILFTIFVLIFFALGSMRGIAITSFIFAINLGIMKNSYLLAQGLSEHPMLWIPYLLVGMLFFVVLLLGLMYSN